MAKTNTSDEHNACPANLTMGLIANKWAIKILYTLALAEKQTLRFGQIQKALAPITQRELTKHLREFEKSGLVSRLVYPEVPPRVEYALTKLGASLREPMDTLSRWAEKNGGTIMKNRNEFEKP
jgi:DNA-binding HxlR family transcriptional regulator